MRAMAGMSRPPGPGADGHAEAVKPGRRNRASLQGVASPDLALPRREQPILRRQGQMTLRQNLLSMTAAAGLLAMPVIALAQQGGSASGSSSMQTTTTQTTPQQGPMSSTAGAHAGATPGGTGATQAPAGDRTAQGATGTRDASGGVMAQGNTSSPRDGTPGNPPSTATQRAMDSVTGNRTPADGTPGNPPGTAAGRAMDRTLGTNTTGTTATGTTTTTTTGTAATTAGASSGAMAVDSAALRNGRRASKIIGSNIYNENNESIGEVEDILIPPTTAAAGSAMPGAHGPVAIVSVGGFLGIGAKLVAVPYERLQWNADRNRWVLPGATKDGLNALPTFSYDSVNGDRRG